MQLMKNLQLVICLGTYVGSAFDIDKTEMTSLDPAEIERAKLRSDSGNVDYIL
jgi:hypothetical protein